jgi:hypothetical protein
MVWWLRQTAHDQDVMGLSPSTVNWMDARYIKKKKMKTKVAKWGTPQKYFKN